MVNKFKAGLSKVSRLSRIIIKNGNHRWPANVLETLETKYHLLPRDLLRLWYVRRKILSDKVGTDSIFIYDWAKACDSNISVKRYNDLNKHPDLLRYRGRIFNDGKVRIEEIRNN
jgi:hypothetical protein